MTKGILVHNGSEQREFQLVDGMRIKGSAMQRIRVLIFVDRFLRGGIQTLIWNMAERIDRKVFDVTFLSLDDGTPSYPMEEDLRGMGYKVDRLNGVWINGPVDYALYRSTLRGFFGSRPRFDVVHMHSSSKNYPLLQAAAKSGVPVRIAHSHSTDFQTRSLIKRGVGMAFSRKIKKYATYWFACSTEAGKWMFGPSFETSPKAHVMRNALPIDRYRFSDVVRSRVRSELGIRGNELVVVNVARLSPQKNQSFLLTVFERLLKLKEDCTLLLVGEGELRDELQEEAEELGISGKVRFLGFRSDVRDLLMASDIMAMTSYHEGLPYAAVEAQATGIPCVFPSTISPEALVLEECLTVSLDESPERWAEAIVECPRPHNRASAEEILCEHGFDIDHEVKSLEALYLRGVSASMTGGMGE